MIALLMAWALAASAWAMEPKTLCQAGEKPYFSCAIGKSGKYVSLCGSLTYRFGKPGKVELEFPKGKGSPAQFQFAHYSRAMVDRTEVSFKNGDFVYTVFNYYEGEDGKDEIFSGVRVGEKELKCSGKVLSELVRLEDSVPCDTDNALNLGGCPAKK